MLILIYQIDLFSHEQFVISKYSSILNALLHSQLHILEFHCNDLILYTYTNIHHDSIYALNYIYFHSIPIYIDKIHAELKILFHVPLKLNEMLLHSYFLLYVEHILKHMDHQ